MSYVKYIDQQLLKKLNDKAIRQGRNRSLRQSFVKSIADDLRLPLTICLPHNDREMRCAFLFGDPGDRTQTPVELWLDMCFDDYRSLPRAEI